MKRKIILGTMILSGTVMFAQQNSTPYVTPFANNPSQAPTTANAAWYRGGNMNTGPAGNANIFGTRWNSPIYTITTGINRSKLNGNVNYPINGVLPPVATGRNGFMLIGRDAPMQSGVGNIYAALGAYSLLHLNGEGTAIQDLGYRAWMRTGLTLTGNRDLSYFGLRQIGAGEDRTETVIAWSDNSAGIADEMAFRFMG